MDRNPLASENAPIEAFPPLHFRLQSEYARMRKFEDATAKSEDERAKLSCYANSQLHIFAPSNQRWPQWTPSVSWRVIVIVMPKTQRLGGEELKMVGLFFFFLVYIQIYWCSYLWICWHMYIHVIKKIILKKKSLKLFKKNFLLFCIYSFLAFRFSKYYIIC